MSEKEMPFLDHLEELRWRIIKSGIALIAGIGFGLFAVARWKVIDWITAPILPHLQATGGSLVGSGVADLMQLTFTAAVWIGFIVAAPVLFYQAWAFLSPALFPKEKRALTGAIAGGAVLFLLGAVFAFKVVLPLSLPFMMSFYKDHGITPMLSYSGYIGFVFSWIVMFGGAFELPMLVLLLTALGLVQPESLARYRRHALVGIMIAAAFLSPGTDVMPMVALTVPLFLLYELSVVIARVVTRRAQARGEGSLLLVFAPLIVWRAQRRPRVA